MAKKKKQMIDELQEKIEQQNKTIHFLEGKSRKTDDELAEIKEENSKLKDEIKIKLDKIVECEKNYEIATQEIEKLQDSGYQILAGFKLIAPFLDKLMGRPFILVVSEEFKYKEASDSELINQEFNEWKLKEGANFVSFRDKIKKEYSIRTTFFYSTKDYNLSTAEGKSSFEGILFPPQLSSGVEVHSRWKNTALFKSLLTEKSQFSVLPEKVFGVPILAYAFPIFDRNKDIIGSISFSNDITQIVNNARSLGNIVDTESDQLLNSIARTLKEELEKSEVTSHQLKDESDLTRTIASFLLNKSKEVIGITEKLKVLALNTAIEATKVEGGGKGIGIIASQMRRISEMTKEIINEVYKKSNQLSQSSGQVLKKSVYLEEISQKLLEKSSVLFDTSVELTGQKDRLASLVRKSIDEIAQNQNELNEIFKLIQ